MGIDSKNETYYHMIHTDVGYFSIGVFPLYEFNTDCDMIHYSTSFVCELLLVDILGIIY